MGDSLSHLDDLLRLSQNSTCNQIPFVRKYFFIIFAPSYVHSSRQSRFKCCDFIFLDNGVMTTHIFSNKKGSGLEWN